MNNPQDRDAAFDRSADLPKLGPVRPSGTAKGRKTRALNGDYVSKLPDGERLGADAYQTAPDLCRYLVTHCLPAFHEDALIVEPSAGHGNFARALRERYRANSILGVDPFFTDPDPAFERVVSRFEDFTPPRPPDLICGNPPYALAQEHILRALDMLALGGQLAFLLRLGFAESAKRYEAIFRHRAPSDVYTLVERPSFTGGTTDASAYAFFVWTNYAQTPRSRTQLHWISWKSK